MFDSEKMVVALALSAGVKRENRVQLGNQRVKPSTLQKLHRLRVKPAHRGIGKALDYCVEAAKE